MWNSITVCWNCWNVRTLYQAGKIEQLAKEMRRYNVSVTEVSKCRLNPFGEVTTSTDEKFLYSGKQREGDPHMQGVGLILSKNAARSLLEWEPVSERIITTRFASRGQNVTIIQCYAPKNLAETEEKEEFYHQLQALMQKTPSRCPNSHGRHEC